MRWKLVKKAWRLAAEAFPGQRVFVPCPLSLSQEGEMPVYGLGGERPVEIARMSYRLVPRGRGAAIELSVAGIGCEVEAPVGGTVGPIRTKTSSIVAAPMVREAMHRGQRKFKDYERVRVLDPMSMEYQEIGQILMSKRTKKGRVYLILVDGSSKPAWFHEDHVAENMAGAEPPDG
jgi:hypothetical protein